MITVKSRLSIRAVDRSAPLILNIFKEHCAFLRLLAPDWHRFRIRALIDRKV